MAASLVPLPQKHWLHAVKHALVPGKSRQADIEAWGGSWICCISYETVVNDYGDENCVCVREIILQGWGALGKMKEILLVYFN